MHKSQVFEGNLKMKKSFVFLTAIFICSLSFAQNFVNPEDVSLQNDYVEASINERFFLAGNKAKNSMTCFEAVYDKGLRKQFIQKWQIPRYWENEMCCVLLSNNGEYCVLDNRYDYTKEDSDKNDVLFWVYKDGKLYDVVNREKYLNAIKKVIEPDVNDAKIQEWFRKLKVSERFELYDIGIYNTGLRLGIYWFDDNDINEDRIRYPTLLWYDFDSKKIEGSLKLVRKQGSHSFDVIAKKFSDAESLIKDKADKEKFCRALEKIMMLAKDADKYLYGDFQLRGLNYANDDFKLTVTIPLKMITVTVPHYSLLGLVTLEQFSYSDGKEKIDFFILDDIYDFAIRVRNGGKISPEHKNDWTRAPDLVYLFETKKGIVKILGKESL